MQQHSLGACDSQWRLCSNGYSTLHCGSLQGSCIWKDLCDQPNGLGLLSSERSGCQGQLPGPPCTGFGPQFLATAASEASEGLFRSSWPLASLQCEVSYVRKPSLHP